MMGLGDTEVVTSDHGLDERRTVVHDYDRAGDYYSAWCWCGTQIAYRVPHRLEADGPGGSIESALTLHLQKVKRDSEVTISRVDLVLLLDWWKYPHAWKRATVAPAAERCWSLLNDGTDTSDKETV